MSNTRVSIQLVCIMNPVKRITRGRKPYAELSARQRNRINNEITHNLLSAYEAGPGDGFEKSSNSRYEDENIVNVKFNCPAVPVAATTKQIPTSSSEDAYDFLNSSTRISSLELDNSSNASISDDRDWSTDDPKDDAGSTSSMSIDSITHGGWATSSDRSSFCEKLATCFVQSDITHQAGDRILAVLRSHECFASLPKTTKTLLETPSRPETLQDVAPGKYLHLGFEKALVGILGKVSVNDIPPSLQIDFSTDGASPDKSGSNQVWPKQCRIANINRSPPGVIGVYRGNKKPQSAIIFFHQFVEEANDIIYHGGVLFREQRIPISLRAFIADAPARAFILNHKGHNSSKACSKCTVVGEYINSRMIFSGVDHPLRTDEEYHRRVDDDHHKEGPSPLSSLPIGLVSKVPFEYQHLVCLGVMKRLLMAWVNRNFSKKNQTLCSRNQPHLCETQTIGKLFSS